MGGSQPPREKARQKAAEKRGCKANIDEFRIKLLIITLFQFGNVHRLEP